MSPPAFLLPGSWNGFNEREEGRQPGPKILQPQEASVSLSKALPARMGTAASCPPSKASTSTTEFPAGWDVRGVKERHCRQGESAQPTTSPGGVATWSCWMIQIPLQASDSACSQHVHVRAGDSGGSGVSKSITASARSASVYWGGCHRHPPVWHN